MTKSSELVNDYKNKTDTRSCRRKLVGKRKSLALTEKII